MEINSKEEFYELQRKGLLGNNLQSWITLKDYLGSGFLGLVALRSKVTGGQFIKYQKRLQVIKKFIPGKHVISEHAPDHLLTIQGETTYTSQGIYLRYSTRPGMLFRDGLRKYEKHAFRLQGIGRIRYYCDPSALDMVKDIFSEYPKAIIELTCYSISLGNLNNNTIIWEVRTGY